MLGRARDTKARLTRDAERAARTVSREASHATALVGKDVRRLTREAKLQAREIGRAHV